MMSHKDITKYKGWHFLWDTVHRVLVRIDWLLLSCWRKQGHFLSLAGPCLNHGLSFWFWFWNKTFIYIFDFTLLHMWIICFQECLIHWTKEQRAQHHHWSKNLMTGNWSTLLLSLVMSDSTVFYINCVMSSHVTNFSKCFPQFVVLLS